MLSSPKKSFINPFVFALFYGVGFYVLQFFLAKTHLLPIRPTSQNLSSWDVGFYDSIKKSGYVADDGNTGFFILFPLIWKLSHLGIWGIIALNILFFATGFSLLMNVLNQKNISFWLLCLTIPPIYFAFLPYTEALFFFLAALSFYAIKSKKLWLIWLSLLLISMVRATTVLLLPALFMAELLSNNKDEWKKSFVNFLLKYALPSLIGLSVFILWQYFETGIWFAYFKKQSEHWGHAFSLPGLPFSNIENGNWRYHWLSALAMLMDITALFWLIWHFFLWLKNKNDRDPNLIFSMGYLAMVLIFLLFFNPKYGGPVTNVMGANRYTLSTPFFIYFLNHYYNLFFLKKDILYYALFANVFFALFGAFESGDNYFIMGLIPTLLIAIFMANSNLKEKQTWIITLLIAFNYLIQMHLFQQFITPMYVD